ncbi:hypothetical protein ABTD85_22240, partial [Acinetobacter baumannii]
ANTADQDGATTDADGEARMTPGAEPLSLKLARDVAALPGLTEALEALRWQKFERLGIALPKIALVVDAGLPAGSFSVLLYSEP